MQIQNKELIDNFLVYYRARGKVVLYGSCILWQGAITSKGYGSVRARLKGGRVYSVHKLVLELSLGRDLKPKHHACHKCTNKACCNPLHLYEGTQSENELDKNRTYELEVYTIG